MYYGSEQHYLKRKSLLNFSYSSSKNDFRQSADYMPEKQLEEVLVKEFGPNWQSDNFKEFSKKPFAAASIGQVHLATLQDDRYNV